MAHQFYSRTKWVVGDGKIIRFWEDEWCTIPCLADQFPELFRLSDTPNKVISLFIENSEREPFEEVTWNLSLPRSLTTRQEEEAIRVFEVLAGICVKRDVADRRSWLDGNGDFSVKSMFHFLLLEGGLDTFPLVNHM